MKTRIPALSLGLMFAVAYAAPLLSPQGASCRVCGHGWPQIKKGRHPGGPLKD
jgi:hypothetical protein